MRWFAYFREVFPSSATWQKMRGRVGVCVNDNDLPGGLVWHFVKHSESVEAGLIACHRFLA